MNVVVVVLCGSIFPCKVVKGVKVVVRGLEFMRAMEEAMKLKCRQKIALDK